MEFRERFYLDIARIFPVSYRSHLKEEIKFGGGKFDADTYLGSTTILAILAFLITLLAPYAWSNEFAVRHVGYALIVFVVIELVAYLVVYFKAEDRTKRVEEVISDALQLIASNVRAGMTPYQALKLAARKEFGPLKEEIERATALALGTESFSKTLLRISDRIRSETLERALKLFTTAMKSGGHLATLLEELALDIDNTKSLKKNLVTSTKQYISFIMFTIIIGAPLLLAISIEFVRIVTGMQSKAGSVTAAGLGGLVGEISITPSFLVKLSIIMLLLTSLLACILLGVIIEGKPKYGFKYSPIVIIGSLVAFFVLRYIIANFFGGII